MNLLEASFEQEIGLDLALQECVRSDNCLESIIQPPSRNLCLNFTWTLTELPPDGYYQFFSNTTWRRKQDHFYLSSLQSVLAAKPLCRGGRFDSVFWQTWENVLTAPQGGVLVLFSTTGRCTSTVLFLVLLEAIQEFWSWFENLLDGFERFRKMVAIWELAFFVKMLVLSDLGKWQRFRKMTFESQLLVLSDLRIWRDLVKWLLKVNSLFWAI